MDKITYKIYTLGCKVNQYDSFVLDAKLKKAGFMPVSKMADIAIINTCAVTKTAIKKAKRMLNKAGSENLNAKTVIMGCWPKIYKDSANKTGSDLIFGVGESAEMIKALKSVYNIKDDKLTKYSGSQIKNYKRARYFIKIQDGCEQYCSYCIIPYARGKLKSRPVSEILSEITKAVANGYKEIVLSGIHLGLYGKDIARRREKALEGGELAKLLKKIFKIKTLGRVRLSSIEVSEITSELIKLISQKRISNTPYVCKHLHIPLQSGSDKILKLMNRPYSVDYFINKVEKIRSLVPNIAITTDIIVGFPGETDKEFAETLSLVKNLKFSRMHIFPFSAHDRTPAASLQGAINDSIKIKRAHRLRSLGKKLAQDYRAGFAGRELELAVESVKNNQYIGKSEYYFDVEFEEKQILDCCKNYSKSKNELIRKIIRVCYFCHSKR